MVEAVNFPRCLVIREIFLQRREYSCGRCMLASHFESFSSWHVVEPSLMSIQVVTAVHPGISQTSFLWEAAYIFSDQLQMLPWWLPSCKLQRFTVTVGDFSSSYMSSRTPKKTTCLRALLCSFLHKEAGEVVQLQIPGDSQETLRKKQL